ncbi:MAG: GntR family transcriptional regulator, partial [Caldimonas sp.]
MNDRLPAVRAAVEEGAAREAIVFGEHTSNHIVRSILAYLKERNLQPGDRLPSERALAEKLGVGRNALREA